MRSTATNKIIVIVGLPGSGKTTLLQTLEGLNSDCTVVDDLDSTDQLPKTLDRTLIISSPHFCIRWKTAVDYLTKRYPNADLKLVFFENDVDAAFRNVTLRNQTLEEPRKIGKSFMDYLSENYVIPEGATVVPIYRGAINSKI